jgi:hypothetical protein
MTPTKTPNKTVNDHNGHYHNGNQSGGPPPGWPRKRTSVFPFLLDLGLVMAAFGLIILRPLVSELASNVAIIVGLVLAAFALVGWLREARAEYKELSD